MYTPALVPDAGDSGMITIEGSPKRLAVLDYGLFRVHSGPRVIGLAGFLVETDRGEHVLIDTGMPPKYARDAAAAGRADGLDEFGEVVTLGPEHTVAGQLRLLGLDKSDVDLLIISHTHIDHVGELEGFAGIPILIGQGERALPRPLYWGNAQPMNWPDREYVTISKDMCLRPGFEVMYVPGHAPGQLAFALQLPRTGTVLILSDAVSRLGEIAEGFSGAWNRKSAATHAERLMRLADDRNAFVIYGHCPEQWPVLPKAPHWFD